MNALLALLLVLTAPPPAADEAKAKSEVNARAHAMLAAWAARDTKKLMALMEPGATVMGPDIAEVCTDASCTEKLLKDSFALFDSAKPAEPKVMHVTASERLATCVFDTSVEFATSTEKTRSNVRFMTTWRHSGTEWKLVQWVRSVPTVEKSAKELVKENVLK
jgi:ketosteroid isomerase-like protein